MSGHDSNIRQIVVDDNRRRSERASAADFQGRTIIVGGEFEFPGTGEAIVNLNFPVVFTEKPFLLGVGGDLANSAIEAGHAPTVTGVIYRYKTEERTPNSHYYTGCELAVVVGGVDEQRMWVHWHVTGVALINPVHATTDTNGTV